MSDMLVPPSTSRSPDRPEPCLDPTTRVPGRGAAPHSTPRSDRSDPRTAVTAPRPHDRPGPYRRPPPAAAGPIRYSYSPERCTRFCCGLDLDTQILAGQAHLSSSSSMTQFTSDRARLARELLAL